MKPRLLPFWVGLLCALSAGAASPVPAPKPQSLHYTVPFKSGEGYPRYRIPAIWWAPGKPLLAFAEGRVGGRGLTGDIDIVLRRSSDRGHTWPPMQVVPNLGADTCGNPCVVRDESNGRLWLALTRSRGSDVEADIVASKSPGTTVWITHSDDDGSTWAEPKDISATARKADWGWYGTGPGAGLYLRGKPDRLLMPSYHSAGGTYRTHSLYSDDHGATWQLDGLAADNTSEPQVIELDNQTLLMNARTIAGFGGQRTQVISRDRGTTWQAAAGLAPLVENQCQGCIYRSSRAGSNGQFDWIFSHPITPARVGVHAWISEDNGRTWPHAQQLWSGPSAYTAMVRLPGGLVGILIECGEQQTYEQIAFMKFAPEWLKAGKAPELKPAPPK
ncbi:MAG: exo-alpha-sialidase [Limisphaerales bacterium]